MAVGTDGWEIWSGETLTHDSSEGYITPFGSAMVSGSVSGVTAIVASCIDVSSWVYFAKFRAEASVMLSTFNAGAATAGISIQNYSDPECTWKTDFTTETREALPGEWTNVSGDFALLEGTAGIRVVLFSTDTPNGGSVRFDDASLTVDQQVEEIFENPDMSESPQGWWLYWGTSINYEARAGHLTPDGSIRTEGQAVVVGSRGPFTGVRSRCVDVSDRAPLEQYKVGASARPDGDAIDPEMGIHVDYYSDKNCRSFIGDALFFGDSFAGVWSRLEGTFVPQEGTKALIVRVRSNGVTDGGGALFDDITLNRTQAVRQLWLIGVGEISNQQIKPFDVQYTRGGAFGGKFDPSTIGREGFAKLEIEFDGCNSGEITYKGDGFQGSYPISRLAENESVVSCNEQGFKNMGDQKGWMAGYWFGGAEHEGEGFVIDVLAGGEQAVVTWYTYMPNWGSDAPR